MNEITKAFYSFETNAPFEKCIECNRYLLDENTEYLIEKAIKNYPGYSAKDVVFDYAICMDCAEDMRKEISKESWSAMMNYFNRNVDFQARVKMANKSIEENVGKCLIKGKAVNECTEYQIYAHCKGKNFNMSNPPYVICGEALDELIELLSDKTIDEMNRFFNKHFSPDPSIMEPTPRLILV